jgi:RNA polymerase sigma-70 factor (ECF subfamily)
MEENQATALASAPSFGEHEESPLGDQGPRFVPCPTMNDIRDIPELGGGPPSSATSRSLLARVRANEPEAWEHLVHLYGPLVLSWCRGKGLQDQDVADIFQEVFQAVVTHVGSFRKERQGDTFRGWLRRITQNKVRDHFRKRQRQAQGEGGSSAQERLAQLAEPSPAEDDRAPEEECGLFARALELIRGEFEERTWSAFWRTAVEGWSPKDVAVELSMSPGAVRVAKSRVLHRLREELGDLME